MSKYLFEDFENTSGWRAIIETYFEVMYSDGFFVKAITNILDKRGFSTDGAYCNFPDVNDSCNDTFFEGVEFACGYPPEESDTIIVSEEIFYQYVKLACDKYLQKHSEDKSQVMELLAKIP